MMNHQSTVIIGAGLAGLACASRLVDRNQSFLLLEATDRVGGRVRTDHVDGFILDHGLQFLTCRYPACQELLDYEKLQLKQVENLGSLPVEGMAAIPQQLADRLPADSLKLNHSVVDLKLAEESHPGRYLVCLSSGDTINSDSVVVATESNAAARLLGNDSIATSWSGTITLYYSAKQTLVDQIQPMIHGDQSNDIQSAIVLSHFVPSYAPAGKALIAVSANASIRNPETTDTDQLDYDARKQLSIWLGDSFTQLELLQVYRIPYGLPVLEEVPSEMSVMVNELAGDPVPESSLYLCGDHRDIPSIQGALNSGLRVADQILT